MLEQHRHLQNPSNPFNYTDLQQRVDTVVGKIGLEKTINLLEGFIGNIDSTKGGVPKAKVIMTFLISRSVELFNLYEKSFFKSREAKYCEARRACFHIMRKHTAYSFQSIGDTVGIQRRTVLYYHYKCEDTLSIANIYVEFKEKYDLLERDAIDFISKL